MLAFFSEWFLFWSFKYTKLERTSWISMYLHLPGNCLTIRTPDHQEIKLSTSSTEDPCATLHSIPSPLQSPPLGLIRMSHGSLHVTTCLWRQDFKCLHHRELKNGPGSLSTLPSQTQHHTSGHTSGTCTMQLQVHLANKDDSDVSIKNKREMECNSQELTEGTNGLETTLVSTECPWKMC